MPVICALCRNDTTILRKNEKQAYYNFLNTSIPNCIACNIDLSKPIICGMHRKNLIEDKETAYTKEDIVDVKHPKCKTPGCKIQPAFNFPGEKKGLYCSKCANKYNTEHPNEIDIENVINPRCKCGSISPSFNFPGEKKGAYCRKCADLTKMKDVVNKYCSSCGLIQINSSTNAYGGLCIECAQHTGIAKRVRNVRVQEKAVAEYLKTHFKNITLSEDKQLEGSCVKTRPDISCDFGNFILIVEIDENQHKGKAYTSCDTKRNVQLLLNGGSRPIVFIRFNPDSFKRNGKVIPACFQKDNTGKLLLDHEDDWNVRLEKLRQEIENVMIQNDSKNVEDLKEMTYVHLYFDE